MRFTIIKDLKKNTVMTSLLKGMLSFFIIYLFSDVFVKQNTLGLFVSEITLSLFGNEEQFIDPMTKASFLEFIHAEIFFLMMLLLTLSAVFIRVSQNTKYSLIMTNALLLFALISLITLFASYFLSKSFISLYVITFFLWHFFALEMSLHSLWRLSFAKSI